MLDLVPLSQHLNGTKPPEKPALVALAHSQRGIPLYEKHFLVPPIPSRSGTVLAEKHFLVPPLPSTGGTKRRKSPNLVSQPIFSASSCKRIVILFQGFSVTICITVSMRVRKEFSKWMKI